VSLSILRSRKNRFQEDVEEEIRIGGSLPRVLSPHPGWSLSNAFLQGPEF
jgi:hypothetical protein